MMRSLNILAIATLIGSATMAYSVKYETILTAEKLKKRQTEMQREKDSIAVLQAEWQILNRPTRLQGLAPPEPGMQPLSARQILRAADVPQRGAETDPLNAMLTGALDTTPRQAAKPALSKPLNLMTARPATTPVKAQARPLTTPALASRPDAPKPATTPDRNASAEPILRPPAPLGTLRSAAPPPVSARPDAPARRPAPPAPR